MRICQNCGAEVPEDASECPKCQSKDIKTEKFCRILGTRIE